MAKTNPALAQLADISEPPIQTGFALAPLWWLLLLLLAATLAFILVWLYRRWRYFAAKREAMALLMQLRPSQTACSEINQLIKRVLQHYQPGHPALSMDSVHWQRWLAFQHNRPLPELTTLLYQNNADTDAYEQFYQFAKCWLQAYRGQAPATIAGTEARHA